MSAPRGTLDIPHRVYASDDLPSWDEILNGRTRHQPGTVMLRRDGRSRRVIPVMVVGQDHRWRELDDFEVLVLKARLKDEKVRIVEEALEQTVEEKA